MPRNETFFLTFFERPSIKTLKSYGEFLLTLIGIYVFVRPLSAPDLEVVYSIRDIRPPHHIEQLMNSVRENFENDDSQRLESFVSSTGLLEIDIVNNTDHELKNLELRINSVRLIAAFSVDALSDELETSIVRNLKYSIDKRKAATLTNISPIPPGANVNLQIWGNFRGTSFFDERVEIATEASHVRTLKKGAVYGIRYFVASNLGYLTLIVLLYFAIVGSKRVLNVRR